MTRSLPRSIILAATAGLFMAPNASAGERVMQGAIGKTVHTGETADILQLDQVTQDCKTNGLPRVSIVVPPKHGHVVVVQEHVTPHFSPGDSHARCNAATVDGYVVDYRSDPGYVGVDHVTVLSRMIGMSYEKAITLRVAAR